MEGVNIEGRDELTFINEEQNETTLSVEDKTAINEALHTMKALDYRFDEESIHQKCDAEQKKRKI